MKGSEWIASFEKKPTIVLIEIKEALETLEKDSDIYREFKDSGLFYGLGNLKYFASEEIRKRESKKLVVA